MMKLGKLKKNLDRSNTPSVVRNFCAFDAFSRTGKNTTLAFCAASEEARIRSRAKSKE
jgi:hypothetical protein